jgi:hypothetical protein
LFYSSAGEKIPCILKKNVDEAVKLAICFVELKTQQHSLRQNLKRVTITQQKNDGVRELTAVFVFTLRSGIVFFQ